MPESWRVLDVTEFADLVLAIAGRGFERPLLVTTDLTVLHRQEEAAAARMLNLPSVPVEIIDLDELLSVGPNGVSFLPTEAVVVGLKLEEILKPTAEQRKAAGRARGGSARQGIPNEPPMAPEDRLTVRAVVAASLGMSTTSYTRARDIVLAGESEPERYGDLISQLEKTNNIAGTHDELRLRQRSNKAEVEVEERPRRKAVGSLFKIMPGREAAAVIQNTLYSLLAAADTFDHLDVSSVSPELAKSWAEDLKVVNRSLTKFRSRLYDRGKESVDG